MHIRLFSGSLFVFLAVSASWAQPLDTAFTYQGRLKSGGSPANGSFDMDFELYPAAAGGTLLASQTLPGVSVTDGLFTVQVDFGAGAFDGNQRWLDVTVNGTLLVPRQELTAAPNALFARNASTAATATTATSATQLNGQNASFYQNAANLSAGTIPDARIAGSYSGLLTLSNAGNAFTGVFTGNGAGLTGLNASNISIGTVSATHGGTGLTNYAPGDLIYASGTSTLSRIAVGSPRSVLKSGVFGFPVWESITGSDIAPPLIITGGFGGEGVIQGISNANTNISSGVHGTETSPDGQTLGVYGESVSTSGAGVFGWAHASSGLTYGGWFQDDSSGGRAVFGNAIANTGSTSGGYFVSNSTSGVGVYGLAPASSGITYGGRFESASTDGRAVLGYATGTTGLSTGVFGESDSTSGRAVFGYVPAATGVTTGVSGESASTSGRAVFGVATAGSGTTYGGRFESVSTDGRAVLGYATGTTGLSTGVFGESDSTSGRAVFGYVPAATGVTTGLSGESASTSGRAVVGIATAGSGTTYGGRFESISTSGVGVYGKDITPSSVNYGVYGESLSGYGVWAQGRFGASGTKAFRIDHPDDPENKYLLHYATESPEVMNFYSGKATLDAGGEAVVELPHYFARINKDPRYTLTAVGAPMPMLHVADEIDEAALIAGAKAKPYEPAPICSFRIAGGAPRAKVSWRVEALRNDLWVQQRGAPVEVDKQGLEKGTYQHPELYGQPPEKGMNYDAAHERPSPPSMPDSTP